MYDKKNAQEKEAERIGKVNFIRKKEEQKGEMNVVKLKQQQNSVKIIQGFQRKHISDAQSSILQN